MQIIAHRGASHDAPENTLAAVRLAWEQGADAVEVDVRMTRDGRLAVIHDADTRRVAGSRRVIANATLAELQVVDVGAWKGESFAGERIPSLDEVLALVPADRRIFVELKGGADLVPELGRCLAAARARPVAPLSAAQVTVITFDLRGAVAAKRALPGHEVCWLAESGWKAPFPTLRAIEEAARVAGLDGIDIESGWPLDPVLVGRIRRDGLKLYVWTVDAAGSARRLAALGIDGVTTNRPGWLREQIEGA